jgi:hypothetical protein
MKKLVKICFLLVLIDSCSKLPENIPSKYAFGEGVFILNEGNFRAGNGSLSFYSYDSSKIFNDLFYKKNSRPLGDIPNSMVINSDNAYIVVNNSGKIEVIDLSTLESKATINKLISPRQMKVISDSKAYVSSIYSDSIAILNLKNNSISGYINMRRSSESIEVAGNYAYIANWMGGKEIMVVNTLLDKVVDSVEVGIEPESMVLDNKRMLWVLCNGGWTRQNFAELVAIDTYTNHINKKLVFPTKDASPTCLQIDGSGQTLFFLDNGVKKMDINSATLPATTLIPQSGNYFYKIGINPVTSDVFITDALDYVQQGYLYIYKKDGTLISRNKTDIIPGSMCFNLRIDQQIK